MANSQQSQAQAAWDRIQALGGHGVWELDMVVVSLADTEVTDEDLKLFASFPFVQNLDLSGTAVGDEGLSHLAHLPALETLNVRNTRISREAIARFRESHPRLEITTQTQPRGGLNPFTGDPF